MGSECGLRTLYAGFGCGSGAAVDYRNGIDEMTGNMPISGAGKYRMISVKAGEPVSLLIDAGIPGRET